LRLRKKYPLFQYVAVPEFQKRGAVHFHAFLWGLPDELGDVRKGKTTLAYGRERESRDIYKTWLHGYVDVVKSDGHPRHISYLMKYMVKSAVDLRLSHVKAYYMSRGIPKPLVFKNDNVDFFAQRFTMDCISESRNRSAWLGLTVKKTYARKI